ncbi:STAS domain-containing protein [Streptomyces sp. NPDC004279]|uniref:STAS domain-containing protein n=1 Tax=Streptomyces sp. NPDC091299 TaxID=3155302 RepID=UPI003431CAEC
MDVSVEAGHSVASWCGGIRLEVYPLMGRPGVRAIGEIGLDTRTAWREVLARLVRSSADRLHVDPSLVTFIDVAGVTDLAVAARSLSGGRRIVVHRPPPQLARVPAVCRPELGGIEVTP